MKPNNGVGGPMSSGRPKASLSPLMWALCVPLGIIWALAKLVGLIVSGPSWIAHNGQLWAVRMIERVIAALRG